jgi:hypothetical protein
MTVYLYGSFASYVTAICDAGGGDQEASEVISECAARK